MRLCFLNVSLNLSILGLNVIKLEELLSFIEVYYLKEIFFITWKHNNIIEFCYLERFNNNDEKNY